MGSKLSKQIELKSLFNCNSTLWVKLEHSCNQENKIFVEFFELVSEGFFMDVQLID